MHIVTQLSGRIMALYSQALVLLKALLLQLVNSLRARFTHIYQSVATISNPLAKAKQSISRLVANLTIQVQLIKLGLINVATKVGQLGQQLLIIARQILQRVLNLLKRGN